MFHTFAVRHEVAFWSRTRQEEDAEMNRKVTEAPGGGLAAN